MYSSNMKDCKRSFKKMLKYEHDSVNLGRFSTLEHYKTFKYVPLLGVFVRCFRLHATKNMFSHFSLLELIKVLCTLLQWHVFYLFE